MGFTTTTSCYECDTLHTARCIRHGRRVMAQERSGRETRLAFVRLVREWTYSNYAEPLDDRSTFQHRNGHQPPLSCQNTNSQSIQIVTGCIHSEKPTTPVYSTISTSPCSLEPDFFSAPAPFRSRIAFLSLSSWGGSVSFAFTSGRSQTTCKEDIPSSW